MCEYSNVESLRFSSSAFLQMIGEDEKQEGGEFFNLVGVTSHMFSTRVINWLVILFLPIGATAFDVAGKAFGNVFYPTQTQIHVEIEAKRVAEKKRAERNGSSVSPPEEP